MSMSEASDWKKQLIEVGGFNTVDEMRHPSTGGTLLALGVPILLG